jgi:3-hydroxyisobutyrate dehydrogenase
METAELQSVRLGWIGTGRMGYEIVTRLLQAGCDVAVYNRTRSKAEPLAELGATIVDRPSDLADRDVVFTMVAGPADLLEVAFGPEGVLSRHDVRPRLLVDSSTISLDASRAARERAEAVGVQLVAAPVSGNPKVVRTGKASVVASGPADAYDLVKPYLELYGRGVAYAGETDGARLVKICHNLMLGIIAQTLAETTVLAEKGGVSRAEYLSFLNDSVMGSVFSRYKSPALVNLDWTPTFTPALLRKDYDLGLAAAEELGSRLPLSERGRELLQDMIDAGHTEVDFQALLVMEAEAAALELVPEDVEVADGLEQPLEPVAS